MRVQKIFTVIFIFAISLVLDLSDAVPGMVDLDGTPIAIHGYDPVAYHTKGRPEKGYNDIIYKYMHMNWHFCSEENKEMFRGNRKKYRPAYNGNCAYGMYRFGGKTPSNPQVWLMKDGRVFLFSSEEKRRKWEQDPESINKSDANWKSLRFR